MSLEKCPTCGRWVGDGIHLGPYGVGREYDDCPESKTQMKILKELETIFEVK